MCNIELEKKEEDEVDEQYVVGGAGGRRDNLSGDHRSHQRSGQLELEVCRLQGGGGPGLQSEESHGRANLQAACHISTNDACRSSCLSSVASIR